MTIDHTVKVSDLHFTHAIHNQRRKKVERLKRKYIIECRGEVPSSEWPDSHRPTFVTVD